VGFKVNIIRKHPFLPMYTPLAWTLTTAGIQAWTLEWAVMKIMIFINGYSKTMKNTHKYP